MVYLIASSPSAGAQIVQADPKTAASDERFGDRDEDRIAYRKTIERIAADLSKMDWKSSEIKVGSSTRERCVQDRYGVDERTAGNALFEAYELKFGRFGEDNTRIKLDFPSPAHAAQWGQETVASLKDLMSSYNTALRFYDGRKESVEAMMKSSLEFFKAQGASDDEARDKATKNTESFEKSLLTGVMRTRSLINATILRLSDQFDVSGPMVKLNNDGTLALGDAVASWGGKAGALTLLAGTAKAPDGAAGRVEPLDGQVREQTDLHAHGLGPVRPDDVPPAGGIVNRVA